MRGCRGRRGAPGLGALGLCCKLTRLWLLPRPRPASPSESAEEHLEETPGAAGTGTLQTLTVDVRHVRKEAEGPRLDGAG